MLRGRPCFACGQDQSEIRLSAKGKPFLTCRACSTRTFFTSWAGLMGTAIMTPLATEAFARIRSDPGEWAKARELADALYREFQTAVSPPSDVSPLAATPAVTTNEMPQKKATAT